jgi:hypothetical protein
MKFFCKTCGHRCHCLGKGYYVTETFCEGCSCNECTCRDKPLILNKPVRPKKFETYTIIMFNYGYFRNWIIRLHVKKNILIKWIALLKLYLT